MFFVIAAATMRTIVHDNPVHLDPNPEETPPNARRIVRAFYMICFVLRNCARLYVKVVVLKIEDLVSC
ncbi:unnamed protein product [Amoebophrya sp. A25]|nr:unnamed protein product [Amoebophrya sp. A25]|eukprot:GSA25T00006051001.1